MEPPLVFDYSSLPREFPRRYLAPSLRFDWEDLSEIFNELASRDLGSLSELEQWLMDESEFDAYIDEQRAIRYFNSTRQTDNPENTRAYEDYVEKIEPRIKVASFGLLKKYVASGLRTQLPAPNYGLEDRRRQVAASIFRVENVELEKQDSVLSQIYQRTLGAMTVVYRGEERTMQQMSKFSEENDRTTREEAWRLVEARALGDSKTLDEIYSSMVRLRDEAARNAGFDNYVDYVFVKKNRFDYTPDDCVKFHEAVEEYLVPLSREIDRERLKKLGVDALRPWDLQVDPEGRPPLSPFETVEDLISRAAQVVAKIDPQLSGYFNRMRDLELLDLESRKGKAPGGYQEVLSEVKLPFIFMNAAKKDNDIRTLLHEAGHSFHSFLIREKGLPYFNGNANLPLEFAEVASMSMEIISGEHYEGTFYNGVDARRSTLEEAVRNVKLFTWIATIDAYQQWVYTHPAHTKEERAEAWVETFDRFRGLESYEGFEDSRRYRWQRQSHLFGSPFYYIEYAIALSGALGLWARYRKVPREAIEAYKDALSLGASRPLPELFQAAGLEWGFGPGAMRRFASQLSSVVREYG